MNPGLGSITQLAHATYVWAAEVPRLATGSACSPHSESLALLRAFVTDAPVGSALQLRYEAPAAPGVGLAPPLLLGRARTLEDALALGSLVALTFPPTHGLRALDEPAVRRRLVPFDLDAAEPNHVAELRRVVTSPDAGQPIVLPWPTTSHDADLAALLERAPAGTILCLHVERAEVSDDVVAHLQTAVQELRDELEYDTDPALHRSLAAHRIWLRELPRGAVQLRVTLVGAQPLVPGLADLVGLAVAGVVAGDGGSSYEVARPRNRHELDLALQLIDSVRAGIWGADDHETAELRFLFGAVEAAAAFRLPALGEGVAPAGPAAAVTHPEVRARLTRQVTGSGDPFLVIDLSRGDYVGLADDLRRAGTDVRRLRLDPLAAGFAPFAVTPGAPRHAHAGRVLAAFDLAYRFSERSPASWVLLNRAVYDAYESSRPAAPALRDVIDAAAALFDRSGAAGGGHELRAALVGRLELLASGPLGAVLQAEAAPDWSAVLGTPTILELGGLSGPAERSLVAGMVLAGILAHREAAPLAPGRRHVVVLAGFDRLAPALFGDSELDGATALADALTALAGSGQEFVIADVAAVPRAGVLPAPDDWSLPTWAPIALPGGAPFPFAAPLDPTALDRSGLDRSGLDSSSSDATSGVSS